MNDFDWAHLCYYFNLIRDNIINLNYPITQNHIDTVLKYLKLPIIIDSLSPRFARDNAMGHGAFQPFNRAVLISNIEDRDNTQVIKSRQFLRALINVITKDILQALEYNPLHKIGTYIEWPLKMPNNHLLNPIHTLIMDVLNLNAWWNVFFYNLVQSGVDPKSVGEDARKIIKRGNLEGYHILNSIHKLNDCGRSSKTEPLEGGYNLQLLRGFLEIYRQYIRVFKLCIQAINDNTNMLKTRYPTLDLAIIEPLSIGLLGSITLNEELKSGDFHVTPADLSIFIQTHYAAYKHNHIIIQTTLLNILFEITSEAYLSTINIAEEHSNSSDLKCILGDKDYYRGGNPVNILNNQRTLFYSRASSRRSVSILKYIGEYYEKLRINSILLLKLYDFNLFIHKSNLLEKFSKVLKDSHYGPMIDAIQKRLNLPVVSDTTSVLLIHNTLLEIVYRDEEEMKATIAAVSQQYTRVESEEIIEEYKITLSILRDHIKEFVDRYTMIKDRNHDELIDMVLGLLYQSTI